MLSRRQVLCATGALVGSAAIGNVIADDVVATEVGRSARRRAAQRVTAFRDEFSAPGVSVAFVREGRILYAGAFGYADLETLTPLRVDHRFRVASVSKPITATAIWKLVENQDLSVGERVFGQDGVLPRFSIASAPQPEWLQEITIDNLLTHSSGGWVNDYADPMFKAPELGWDELIQQTIDTAPLMTAPGKVYGYSNFGYCLLGRVVEARTGLPYETAVRQLVLAPAGCGTMVVGRNDMSQAYTDEVTYYDQVANPYAMNVARMDAHGGWVATASELANFVLAVDGYRRVPDILSKQTVERMIEPGPATQNYSRGWSINPRHNNRWHNGSMPGTSSIMVRVEGGGHFAGLVNTRVLSPDIGAALDGLMWSIYDDL